MSITQKIGNGISKTAEIGMCLAIAGIGLSVASSVFLRNFFSMSIDVVVDANRIMFVWATFFGLVRVNGEGTLIRFELIEQKLSASARKVLLIVQKAACLILYTVMTVAGIQVLNFAKAQVFPTMPISLIWLYLPVATAGFLLIIQTALSFANPAAKKTT
ncbi:MAG: TRAP transporter small permease subunit [Treponemataceae bacterium]